MRRRFLRGGRRSGGGIRGIDLVVMGCMYVVGGGGGKWIGKHSVLVGLDTVVEASRYSSK